MYFGTPLRLCDRGEFCILVWKRDVLSPQIQQNLDGGNEITRKEIEKGKIFQLLRNSVKFHKF